MKIIFINIWLLFNTILGNYHCLQGCGPRVNSRRSLNAALNGETFPGFMARGIILKIEPYLAYTTLYQVAILGFT